MTTSHGADQVGLEFIQTVTAGYRICKEQAERALAQLSDEDWHRQIDPETNSIAIVVRHLSGNLRSRWQDFLTTDGEKASRQRDDEFEAGDHTTAEMLAEWNAAFDVVFSELERLRPEHLLGTVTIRGQRRGVMDAVLRNYEHLGHHVGQIVMLAKHWRGSEWQTLSMPKRRAGA